MPNESLIIEQNGFYYEQNDITITSYWAWEKVSEMLPYDYMLNTMAVTTSAPKEIITPAVAEPAKPVVTTQTVTENEPSKQATTEVALTEKPLTLFTWRMEESRVIDGNNVSYYKRGGQENTINFDNDFYKFNLDNTGIYSFNGQDYKFNWTYRDAEKTKMEMIILYPSPLIVNLENITLTASSFKYTRMQKINGLNYVAIETRTIK